MIPVLSREQMRAFDERAINQWQVPGVVLMENAGRGAADVLERRLADRGGDKRPLILCGPGNNGGDGFVVARQLLSRGLAPRVFVLGDPEKIRGDARINYLGWRGLGQAVTELGADLGELRLALAQASVVVDALFGTGLARDLEGLARAVVELCNQSQGFKVALDLPSGVDANTGRVLGAAFRADLSVSFAQRKLGLLTPSGKQHSGELVVVDIGVPPELAPSLEAAPGEARAEAGAWYSARLVEASDVRPLLPQRGAAWHKGSAGKVTVLGGSAGKSGAGLLAARAALRAGAGLVTLCNFPDAVAALEPRVLEVMTCKIDPVRTEASLMEHLSDQDAVVVGPGLGLDSRAKSVAQAALSWPGAKLFDADALSLFAGRASELANHSGELVLTPHPTELGRLLGVSTQAIEDDRYAAVARASELCQASVLLKGPYTLVHSPGCGARVNPTGNAALATAGSGDVLSGVIGALLTQLPGDSAALAGAYLHGLAADLWAKDCASLSGLLASELADRIPSARAALSCG